jgi:hypothetical protein
MSHLAILETRARDLHTVLDTSRRTRIQRPLPGRGGRCLSGTGTDFDAADESDSPPAARPEPSSGMTSYSAAASAIWFCASRTAASSCALAPKMDLRVQALSCPIHDQLVLWPCDPLTPTHDTFHEVIARQIYCIGSTCIGLGAVAVFECAVVGRTAVRLVWAGLPLSPSTRANLETWTLAAVYPSRTSCGNDSGSRGRSPGCDAARPFAQR